MNVEILTVGTELLLGFTVDTNSAEMAQMLAPHGVKVLRRTAIGDDPAAIRQAVSEALTRTGFVIVTGGLGPTRDDMTKQAVAGLFATPLEFREEIWQELLDRFRHYRRTLAESNRSQAMVPRGATVLANRRGTAPGIWMDTPAGTVILLPGVPVELRGLMRDEVVPRVSRLGGGSIIQSRTIRTSGIAESTLAERLGEIESEIAPATLAYLPGYDGVDIRLTVWDLPPEQSTPLLERAAAVVYERAAGHVYGEDTANLAAALLDRARSRGEKIAVAESCTGGLVGGRITAIPGSSDVFLGGVIAYDDRVKVSKLGVDPALIAAHGAVSESVCVAMAQGAIQAFGATAAIAITGIAGPGGATPEKPVGLVWYASIARGETKVQSFVFPGGREEIRTRAAQSALFQLHSLLRP